MRKPLHALKTLTDANRLVKLNSELGSRDRWCLIRDFYFGREPACLMPGLGAPYFFHRDFATLVYGHRAIQRLVDMVHKLPLLGTDAIVFDVGANNGWFSRALVRRGHMRAAYLFEPNRRLFAALARNLNDLALDYKLHEIALSNQDGETMFYVPQHNSQHSSLDHDAATYTNTKDAVVEQMRVKTRSLDSFCASENIDQIDLLKVDVQGAEHDLLLGATRMLPRVRNALFEVSFLDRNAHQTLALLHASFPRMRVLGPVSYGADLLFSRE